MTPSAPSLSAAIALHARIELRRLLRLRRAWPALAIVVVTSALGGLVLRRNLVDLLALPHFFSGIGLPAIALCALGYGNGVLRGEAERGALSLFLLRPRGAVALPVGRAIAAAIALSACGLALAAALAAVAALFALTPPAAHLLTMMLAGALAGAAYSTVAMLLSAHFRRSMAASLSWLVVVDGLTASRSETIAWISPRPHLVAMIERGHDLPLVGVGSGDLWLGVAHVLAIAGCAIAALLWRFRGDEPA